MSNPSTPRGGGIPPATQRAALEAAAAIALAGTLREAIGKGYTVALVPGGNPAALLELCGRAYALLGAARPPNGPPTIDGLRWNVDRETWCVEYVAALKATRLEDARGTRSRERTPATPLGDDLPPSTET